MAMPNYFVYIAGKGQREEAKMRAFASIMRLSAYDAKVMLGAPGPRKVAAHVKQEDAEQQVLQLRQAGLLAIIIDKQRFSKAPALFLATRAVETPEGMTFSLDRLPDFPLPKGFAKAVVLGVYTEATRHADRVGPRAFNQVIASTTRIRNPFIHIYSDDVHTVLDIRAGKFESPWLEGTGSMTSEQRWQALAQKFASYYGVLLDDTLFKSPDEVNAITSALNVSADAAMAAGAASGGQSTSDDTPVALAASRVIVQCLVYGL